MDYSTYNSDNPAERKEGEILENEGLSTGLTDEELARAIGNRLSQSEAFWNRELGLDKTREEAEKYWLGNYYDESKLYDFQVPYKDNRIFVSIESVIPLALSKPPQPVVTEAYDTDASRELAHNIEKWLLGKYEDLYLKNQLMLIARHLLIGYRLGVMKYRWDDSIGQLQEDGTRFGDIAVDVKRPQRVVLDAGAQDIDNIPLVGEYLTASLDELCAMYPNKKDEIFKRAGVKAGTPAQLNKRLGYVEVWFDHYNKGAKETQSIVVHKFNDLVLDEMKNPHWNYEETKMDETGQMVPTNFFDKPKKPYVFFNFLNIGRYVIDDTSLTDQAKLLQQVLDKRGRQIVENADQANSGMILNGDMVKATEVAKLLGDPGEKLVVQGDVRMAAARLPINLLPEYVMQDKIDARNEIDNIYSTHGALRGEVTNSKTLGQDVLSQRGDASRIQTLATSIEDGADRLYKGMVQMAKVFYDIPQLQRFTSPEGGASFTQFGQNQVEPGIKVRVKTGSVLPDDPVAKFQETKEFAPLLDPLSIAEGLNKDNPKEFAKRMLYYRIFPDKYMSEFLQADPSSGGIDPSAQQDIDLLNSGKEVPPQQNPTKEHLATHQAFFDSPQFKQLPPEIQQLHQAHMLAEVEAAKQALGMQGERPGVPAAPPEAPPTNPETDQAPPPIPDQPGVPQQPSGFLAKAASFVKGGGN